MKRPRSLARGLAAGGVVGGHALAYALAYPVAEARHAHLHETGHHGFPLLLVAGLAAAGAVLALTFVRAARREGTPPPFRMLLHLQVGLFLWLELGERGFDLAKAGADPAVVLGVALQVVLAFGLAWLARGAAAAGRLFAAAPRRPAARPGGSTSPVRVAEPLAPDPIALGPRRAPPSLAVG